MICHHHNCIFIHIPKTAGQSIEQVFLDLLRLNWETRAPLLLRQNDWPELGPPHLAHLIGTDYVKCKYLTQEIFDDYYKFSFVRNPWDRMVSIYKQLGYFHRYDFKSFLINIFEQKVWERKYWFVRPQSDFVCNEDGKLLVDFVGRFENLQNDFYDICEKINLPLIELPFINKTKKAITLNRNPGKLVKYAWYQIKGKQIQFHKNYQDYYDSESRDLVATIYQSDIELFEYRFD